MLKAPLNSCIYTYDTKGLSFDKNMTYSGYKKTQVFQQLKKSILKGEVDKRVLGSRIRCILLYGGCLGKIMLFACKEINYANPNLPTYLYRSFRDFKRISYSWSKKEMCDSQELRNRLCEFICILVSLKEISGLSSYKKADFKIKNMKRKMIARDVHLINGI